MKHLKLYENKNSFWLVIYCYDLEDDVYELYPDKESAENSILMVVNDLKKEMYEEDDLILDIEEAIDSYYYRLTGRDRIEYKEIKLSGKVELSEELKIAISSRKFDL